MDGPCTPWPIDSTCCPDFPTNPAEWTPRHHMAQRAASAALWRASGGIYGVCDITLRPCRDICRRIVDIADRYWSPYVDGDGQWRNEICGCTEDCGCSEVCTVSLKGPVVSITSVMIDGVIIPVGDYQLWGVNHDKLARVAGDCWPVCQDLTAADNAAGAFTVRYVQGVPVPDAGILAVSVLACHYFKYCQEASGDCPLPGRWTTLTREGITLTRPAGPGEPGYSLTGLPLVDDWIALVNPHGATERASVWSLDLPRPQRWSQGPVIS